MGVGRCAAVDLSRCLVLQVYRWPPYKTHHNRAAMVYGGTMVLIHVAGREKYGGWRK